MSEITDPIATPETGRREFFSKAAIAAAAAAVAGVSISSRAQAANGDTVVTGSTTTGTSNTTLSGGTSFRVLNGTSQTYFSIPVSIYGENTSSTAAIGVGGLADGSSGIGVAGSANGTSGIGVYGVSRGAGGRGVYGYSEATSGAGLYGEHNGAGGTTTYPGTGVIGISYAGAGVIGSGTSFDFQATGSGKIGLGSAGTVTSTTSASAGTLARDASGNMWVAVATNDWRKVAGPESAGTLHLLPTPTRVYDSRAGKLPNVGTKAPLTSGSRTINCTKNSSGVPTDAKGVIVNVTVLWTSAAGYVAVTPGGAGDTGTSTANSPGAGAKTASSVTVGCGDGAKIDVSSGSGAAFDFIVDVNGYYV